MLCPVCGTENWRTSGSCSACGADLARASFSSPTVAVGEKRTSPFAFAPGDAFGDRYTIVEKIGAGGMGQVYKAIDRRLGQSVALKLVSPGTPRSRGLERFRRELTLAQRVSHPNVCRVHDMGVENDIHFISMEYIEGQSLGDWTQAVGRLSAHQTLALARQLCAGLAAIHGESIVHRDLKPTNIMLDRTGRAVVMDFGLAFHPKTDQITAEGEVLGTLAYLSPEQARGEALDKRSDIYALGLILFEMLTGRRPPADGKSLPLALRDPAEDCPPPSQIAPGVPAPVDAIVSRCIERDRDRRFQDVAEIDRALEEAEAELAGTRARRRTAVPVLRLWWGVVAALTLMALLILRLIPPGPISVAVMPLRYEGGESYSYLGTLLPLVMTRNLNRVNDLELAPFESTRSFQPGEDPQEVARQLGVDWVVTGHVEVRDDRYQGEVGLFASDEPVAAWSKGFSGQAVNVLDLADLAARNIAEALGKRATTVAESELSQSALAHYVEGKRLLEGWDVESNYSRAAEAFLRAIDAQADFAEAHAGLALAWWTNYQETGEAGLVGRAFDEAYRATSLAPSLPEAYLALGVLQLGTGRTPEATASFQKALDLAPADDAVCREIADAYAALGRTAQAERMYDRAIRLRPEYWENYNYKGAFYLGSGRWSLAKDLFREVIRLRPESDLGYNNLATAHLLAGELGEAEPLLRAALRLNPTAEAYSNLGFIRYSEGNFEEAAREFARATELGPEGPLYFSNLGDAYRRLERPVEAKTAYRRAIELGEARLEVNANDPEAGAELSMALAGYGRCDEANDLAAQSTGAKAATPTIHYYAAISYVLCGDPDAAVHHAARAMDGGVDIRTSPDLRPLMSRLSDAEVR